ncbi:MAG: MCP four helix bundle domain-containing protein [Smithellaceae bacterium]|nr:MCP four helix bundle domain-containing protein [Smithellaceae bacterium]
MNSSNNLKSGQNALTMQVLILAVVIVIIACIGLFIQKSSTSTIFNKSFKNYQRSTALLKDINSVTTNIYKIKNMVASGQDSQEIKKVSDQQLQTMAKDVDIVKQALESDLADEQKKFYQAISDNMTAYQQATQQVIRLAPQGTGAAYLSVSDEKREAITQLLTQLLEYESGVGEEAYNSSGTIFYIVVAVLIILLGACAVLIPSFIKKMVAASVVEPLEETSGVLREYASGKYSRSLTWEADDAIGDLVQSVNALRSKMSASPAPAQKAAEPAAAPAEEKGKSLSDMVKKTPEPAKDGTKAASPAKKAIDKLQDI